MVSLAGLHACSPAAEAREKYAVPVSVLECWDLLLTVK